MMFIILTLIVLVAAMNVVASFTMLVRVKRGSIAILRTMGRRRAPSCALSSCRRPRSVWSAPRRHALAPLVCANMPALARPAWGADWRRQRSSIEVEFITSSPVRVQASEVLTVMAIAILLSLAAAAYPAWRGTRVEPCRGTAA
jgi:lipoprotein-releasing system permease protein